MDYGPTCDLALRRTTSSPPKLELVIEVAIVKLDSTTP